MTPDEATKAIEALAKRLKAAGVDLPVDQLMAGARVVSADIGAKATRQRIPLSIRLSQTRTGVHIALSGRGAKLAHAAIRRDLLRRLPEMKALIRADLLRKMALK